MILPNCKGDKGLVDQNTIDMTAPRLDGHRFLRDTTYDDYSYDAHCIKCGVYIKVNAHGEIIEAYS